jgi:hypothetical protein
MQTGHRVLEPAHQIGNEPTEPATLVWIDSAEALIVTWDGRASIEHVISDVPSRHRRTGHIRRDPSVGHGCSGPAGGLPDRDRGHQLRAYLARAGRMIPDHGPVLIVGPGQVHGRLARLVRDEDRRHGRSREIRTDARGPCTERQLVAEVRQMAGDPPWRQLPDRGGA